MCRKIFTGILLLTLAFFADAQNSEISRFALYIGSNQGGPGRSTLRYAGDDAKGVADVMEEIGGIVSNQRIILLDPDIKEIDNSISLIKTRVDKAKSKGHHTELFLYYSGHSDEQGLLLGDETYQYSHLRSAIKNIDSDVQVAILDSCASGAFTRTKGGRKSSPFIVDEATRTEGHAFLTSSSENESAQESDSIGGSFFTYYLITGLRGAADYSGDNKVTLNEAYRYAFDETLARTINTQAGPQHPNYEIQLNGSGDLILTNIKQDGSQLILTEDVMGRVFVQEETGRVLAELRKDQGTTVNLALPSQIYLISLDLGNTLLSSRVNLKKGRIENLSLADFKKETREATVVRGTGAPSGTSNEDEDFEQKIVKTTEELLNQIYTFQSTVDINKDEDIDKEVYQGIKLGLYAKNYRVEGASIGFISHVEENLRGSQLSVFGSYVGKDVQGGQLSGLININGGQLAVIQASGLFNIAGNLKGIQLGGLFNHSLGSVHGIQAGGLYNISSDDSSMVQLSGLFGYHNGSNRGIQLSGIFSVVRDESVGMQLSGLLNVAGDSFNGLQGSGLFNFSRNDSQIAQFGGLSNYHMGSFKGAQFAGLFNFASKDASGAQVAAIMNYSGDDMSGIQISSILNIAGTLKGTQISIINTAGRMEGRQFGLINIAKNLEGPAFGLVSIGGNTKYHAITWIDDHQNTYVGLKTQNKKVYNIYYGGLYNDELVNNQLNHAILGIGLGYTWEIGLFDLSSDVSAKIHLGDYSSSFWKTAPYWRTKLSLDVLDKLSAFGGIGFDINQNNRRVINDENQSNYAVVEAIDIGIKLYPSFFLGLSY
ncbi:caspase family protein [Spirochaeta cellobiosiphila]|uniref:caspase family protein n=1 Tax=Spirochaeta cellobiosiphila TaxID=504483 RepID=UPI000409C38F|nr:caspase family protein [Spirochaeta cellobiosiphila]